MSSTRAQSSRASRIDFKPEVVTLPVTDADRAKQFYMNLGWRLDADFPVGDGSRAIQLTPPGSCCSVHLGKSDASSAPVHTMKTVRTGTRSI